MRKNLALLLVVSAFAFTSQGAYANTVWDWSFGGESGQFVTNGSGPGPGTYKLIDFSVTSSSAGGTIGSLLGGQYTDGDFSTYLPYSFVYDGSAVTKWLHSGSNLFDWWTFDSGTSSIHYFFGWDKGNINDPTKAAWWISDPTSHASTVKVVAAGAPVPEPVTMLLLGIGIAGLAGTKLRALRSSPK